MPKVSPKLLRALLSLEAAVRKNESDEHILVKIPITSEKHKKHALKTRERIKKALNKIYAARAEQSETIGEENV
jgi:hypothetical protein